MKKGHQGITVNTVRAQAAITGGLYYEMVQTLPAEEQARIYELARELVSMVHNMGAVGALELLAKLGAYMVEQEGRRK